MLWAFGSSQRYTVDWRMQLNGSIFFLFTKNVFLFILATGNSLTHQRFQSHQSPSVSLLYYQTFMAYKNCEMTKNPKKSIKILYSSYRYHHPYMYVLYTRPTSIVSLLYYRQVFAELKWDFDRTGKHCLRCRHRLCTLSWY